MNVHGTARATALPTADDMGGEYADFGCEVNAISPEKLFQRYEASRFMYPAKGERLAPFWPLIMDNWKRARQAGELLNCVVTYQAPGGGWASLTKWRTTHEGWHSQHLVSAGSRGAARNVLLAAQAVAIREGRTSAVQNWFRPDNPFPALAFGSIVDGIGSEAAAVIPGDYLMMPLSLCQSFADAEPTGKHPAEELDGGRCPELAALAVRCRGAVYTDGEGLDRDDLLLGDVDRLYGLVGLRRYRRIWAQRAADGRIHAAAVAYRGPFGFNFSFLENRCDLLIDPALDSERAQRAARSLLAATCRAYEAFPLGSIPVVAGPGQARSLVALGGEHIEAYTQGIWLARGFGAWCRHISDFYRQHSHAPARAR